MNADVFQHNIQYLCRIKEIFLLRGYGPTLNFLKKLLYSFIGVVNLLYEKSKFKCKFWARLPELPHFHRVFCHVRVDGHNITDCVDLMCPLLSTHDARERNLVCVAFSTYWWNSMTWHEWNEKLKVGGVKEYVCMKIYPCVIFCGVTVWSWVFFNPRNDQNYCDDSCPVWD